MVNCFPTFLYNSLSLSLSLHPLLLSFYIPLIDPFLLTHIH